MGEAAGAAEEFAIRVSAPMRPVMAALGMPPGRAVVRVHPDRLEVRMGWSFRAAVPRRAISSAGPDRRRHLAIGVHGWAGRWLVNGSLRGLVRIDVSPPARARATGVPVRLSELVVSVEDPAGLIAALGFAPPPPTAGH